jgi:hypothetical protein
MRHRLETMNAKMMHDMFMQKCDDLLFFLKELPKLIINIVEEHGFIVKILQSVPFSRGKNETKEEVL